MREAVVNTEVRAEQVEKVERRKAKQSEPDLEVNLDDGMDLFVQGRFESHPLDASNAVQPGTCGAVQPGTSGDTVEIEEEDDDQAGGEEGITLGSAAQLGCSKEQVNEIFDRLDYHIDQIKSTNAGWHFYSKRRTIYDVSEVYSPPRVIEDAAGFGL